MKKAVFAVMAIVMAGSVALADVEAGRGTVDLSYSWGVGIKGNYVNMTDGDDGSGVGLVVCYVPSQIFAVEGAIEFLSVDAEVTGVGTDVDVDIIPLSLTAKYLVPVSNRFLPYLGAGVGVYFNDADDIEMDNSLAIHVLGGCDLMLSESWSIFGEVKYTWSSADSDTINDDIELDNLTASLGLKYYFE